MSHTVLHATLAVHVTDALLEGSSLWSRFAAPLPHNDGMHTHLPLVCVWDAKDLQLQMGP